MRLKLILLFFASSLVNNIVLAQDPPDAVIDSVTVTNDTSVRVVWPANTSPLVDSFTIYRLYPIVTGSSVEYFNVVARVPNTTTSYVYTQPSTSSDIPSKQYLRFFVGTYNIASNKISGLDTFNINAHQTVHLSSTEDLCAKAANLTWTEYVNDSHNNGWSDGIVSYEVYESLDGAPYTLKAQGPTLFSYNAKLLGATTFRYKIIARGNGGKTSTSNIVRITPNFVNPGSLTYVRGADVSINNRKATISWFVDTAGAAQNPGPKTFVIFSSTDGINYSEIKRTTVPFNTNPRRQAEVSDLNFERNSYYFTVGTESVQPGCPPVIDTSINHGKTILLKATYVSDLVNNLTWSDYEEWLSGVAKYEVYRVVDNVDSLIATYDENTTSHQDVMGSDMLGGTMVSYYVTAYEKVDPIDPYNETPEPVNSNYAYVYKDLKILVPEVFTPNGRNPVFLPKVLATQLGGYNLKVFNRWGKMMFESKDELVGWDGREDGNSIVCPPGGYVYVIEVKDSTGKTYKKVGNIVLID